MSSSEFSTKSILWTLVGSIFTTLVGVNIFFVRGLVEKIEKVDGIETRMSILENKIDFIVSGIIQQRRDAK